MHVRLFGCPAERNKLPDLSIVMLNLQVSLTNGSNVLYGCVNVTATGSGGGGCNTTNVTSASFTFQPGERVTNMTLWPGYNAQGEADQRAGAINFATSLVSSLRVSRPGTTFKLPMLP